ncbi:MAG: DEAD/DEAH box helicase [Myxococcota bacterium]|nr:DEAD/DEAH box helicase [Myxococcota bacterium]
MDQSVEATSSSFLKFRFSRSIQDGIEAAGFSSPRPIQEQTISETLKGRDVLGLAQTGTGKTAAFALPILQQLEQDKSKSPRALVIAPTRELAAQIDQEIRTLARFTNLRTVTIYGGVGMNPQVGSLRRGADIVIACPGRLLDLVQQKLIKLQDVQILVLDEADHMFDMGFLPDIRRILKAIPTKRQNLLFSATMPKAIRHLANDLLNNPHVIELAHSAPAETITQAFYPVAHANKFDLLEHLCNDESFIRAIVFTRTKHRAKRLASQISSRMKLNAVALQGNLSQSQRDRAMQGFRKGQFDILVATDIAARGIDVANVSHVINFDIPDTAEAYTHRIGRTGRSEQTGEACTFITPENKDVVKAIEKHLGTTIHRVKVPGMEVAPERPAGTPQQPRRTRQKPGTHTPRATSGGNTPPRAKRQRPKTATAAS